MTDNFCFYEFIIQKYTHGYTEMYAHGIHCRLVWKKPTSLWDVTLYMTYATTENWIHMLPLKRLRRFSTDWHGNTQQDFKWKLNWNTICIVNTACIKRKMCIGARTERTYPKCWCCPESERRAWGSWLSSLPGTWSVFKSCCYPGDSSRSFYSGLLSCFHWTL